MHEGVRLGLGVMQIRKDREHCGHSTFAQYNVIQCRSILNNEHVPVIAHHLGNHKNYNYMLIYRPAENFLGREHLQISRFYGSLQKFSP